LFWFAFLLRNSLRFRTVSKLASRSVASGVGQPRCSEEETLADVRRADARSAQICRPEGVARGFHVS
jgi:hypothetical protein